MAQAGFDKTRMYAGGMLGHPRRFISPLKTRRTPQKLHEELSKSR